MNPVAILAALLVVLVFAGILTIAMKAENKKTNEIVSSFSPEQKERLMNAGILPARRKNCWIQEMLIVQAKDRGGKTAVKAIYYNLTIRNNTYRQFCPADFTVPKDVFNGKGLRPGVYVSVFVDPEKGARLASPADSGC